MSGELLKLYVAGIILVSIAGLYYLLVTTNYIRALIGVELMMKAVTLGIILTGRLTGHVGLAQSLVITLIVVEVVVMVVAVGLILLIHRHTDRLNVRELHNNKG